MNFVSVVKLLILVILIEGSTCEGQIDKKGCITDEPTTKPTPATAATTKLTPAPVTTKATTAPTIPSTAKVTAKATTKSTPDGCSLKTPGEIKFWLGAFKNVTSVGFDPVTSAGLLSLILELVQTVLGALGSDRVANPSWITTSSPSATREFIVELGKILTACGVTNLPAIPALPASQPVSTGIGGIIGQCKGGLLSLGISLLGICL